MRDACARWEADQPICAVITKEQLLSTLPTHPPCLTRKSMMTRLQLVLNSVVVCTGLVHAA
jgi:hypothetical protein